VTHSNVANLLPVLPHYPSLLSSHPASCTRSAGSQLTPSAAAPANLVGMEYESMGHVRPETLPTFTGFHTAVKFSDVGMVGGRQRSGRKGRVAEDWAARDAVYREGGRRLVLLSRTHSSTILTAARQLVLGPIRPCDVAAPAHSFPLISSPLSAADRRVCAADPIQPHPSLQGWHLV
jgi:hypothetical protein